MKFDILNGHLLLLGAIFKADALRAELGGLHLLRRVLDAKDHNSIDYERLASPVAGVGHLKVKSSFLIREFYESVL